MNIKNTVIKPEWTAGAYTAFSDHMTRYFVSPQSSLGSYLIPHSLSPYLIHQLNPAVAGFAGYLISLLAQKCCLYATEKWLPTCCQSGGAHLATYIFCHLTVGTTLGLGASLFIPAAGITVTTGVALSFASLLGKLLHFYVKESPRMYWNFRELQVRKGRKPEPFNDNIMLFFMVIPMIAESILMDSFLITGFTDRMAHFGLNFFIRASGMLGAGLFLEILPKRFNRRMFSPFDLLQITVTISALAITHLAIGAFFGYGLGTLGVLGLTVTKGLLMGATAAVESGIWCLAMEFDEKRSLDVLLDNADIMLPSDEEMINTLIFHPRKQSDFALLSRRYIRPFERHEKTLPGNFIKALDSIVSTPHYKKYKMTEEYFLTWKSENEPFLETIFKEKPSLDLDPQKSYLTSDIVGLHFALTKTELILELAMKNSNILLRADLKIFKKLFPQFIEDIGFIGNLSLPNLFEKLEEVALVKRLETLMLCLKRKGISLGDKPTPIQDRIKVYSQEAFSTEKLMTFLICLKLLQKSLTHIFPKPLRKRIIVQSLI